MSEKLLLHVCCGPCATHVVELLSIEHEVVPYFYNPNIEPEEEYQRRLGAARVACPGLAVGPYDNPAWRNAVSGMAEEPEGGKRCLACYEYR